MVQVFVNRIIWKGCVSEKNLWEGQSRIFSVFMMVCRWREWTI
jgi:hypothetical protein